MNNILKLTTLLFILALFIDLFILLYICSVKQSIFVYILILQMKHPLKNVVIFLLLILPVIHQTDTFSLVMLNGYYLNNKIALVPFVGVRY